MLLIATSLIGAVVMPHNLYLHSALVLVCKEQRERRRDRTGDLRVFPFPASLFAPQRPCQRDLYVHYCDRIDELRY
jgi:hypothetical protein